jgi:hypothetical protein
LFLNGKLFGRTNDHRSGVLIETDPNDRFGLLERREHPARGAQQGDNRNAGGNASSWFVAGDGSHAMTPMQTNLLHRLSFTGCPRVIIVKSAGSGQGS